MSLSEMKKQIATDIATSYSNQIISNNQDIDSSVVGIQFIESVQSGNAEKACTKCVTTFLSQHDIDRGFHTDDPQHDIYLSLYKKINTGVCRGLCHVSIEDITQNNVLIYKIGHDIKTEIDYKKIADYVNSELQKRYGYTDTSDTFVTNITSIIKKINSKATERITQNINDSQAITTTGSGDVVGVSQTLVINAVMYAIQSNDTSVDLIQQMVDKQIEFIQKEVDKNVIGDFTYVWQQTKWYIIGCGIFLLSLVIITIVLLMYKASK